MASYLRVLSCEREQKGNKSIHDLRTVQLTTEVSRHGKFNYPNLTSAKFAVLYSSTSGSVETVGGVNEVMWSLDYGLA